MEILSSNDVSVDAKLGQLFFPYTDRGFVALKGNLGRDPSVKVF